MTKEEQFLALRNALVLLGSRAADVRLLMGQAVGSMGEAVQQMDRRIERRLKGEWKAP